MGNTGEKIVIEYVEDDVNRHPDSDFSKSVVRIDNGKDGVLPSSKFVDFIEKIMGTLFILRS